MHPVQWEQVGGHSKKVVFLPSRLEPLFTPGLASSFLLDVVENSAVSSINAKLGFRNTALKGIETLQVECWMLEGLEMSHGAPVASSWGCPQPQQDGVGRLPETV